METMVPGSDQAYSAFISHASQDRPSAEAICLQLERAGFRCWMAPRDIRPGENYPDAIIRGIEASKCLILVMSTSANASAFVRNEVERAYSKGKPLFPVRMEDVLPSRSLELFVSTAHWIDARRGDMAAAADSLAIRLGEDAGLPGSFPPELARRIVLRRRMRLAGVVAVASAAALAVALIVRTTSGGGGPDKFEKPASVNLFAGLYTPGHPLKLSVLVQDGYDQDGVLDSFKSPMTFMLFNISQGNPNLVFTSLPGQFANFFQKAPVFDVSIPGPPARLATCLAYQSVKTGRRQATVTGFTIGLPASQVASVETSNFAQPESTFGAEASGCSKLVGEYVEKNLKGALVLKADMAEQAKTANWSGQCGIAMAILITCRVTGAPVTATGVALGFDAVNLPFTTLFADSRPIPELPGQPGTQAAVIPALGRQVFAKLLFSDRSASAVRQIDFDQRLTLPHVVPVSSVGIPPLYVTMANQGAQGGEWSIALVGPEDTGGASFSRDGAGWLPMTGPLNVLAAKVTAAMLDRPAPTAPGTAPFPLQIRLTRNNGQSETRTYKVDFWDVSRLTLRSMGTKLDYFDCTHNQYIGHSTSGGVAIQCLFKDPFKRAPGLLFSRIWWGSSPTDLHDADADMVSLSTQASDRTVANIVGVWRRCRLTGGGDCFEPSLLWPGTATTLFFKVQYWDGVVTEPVAIAVR